MKNRSPRYLKLIVETDDILLNVKTLEREEAYALIKEIEKKLEQLKEELSEPDSASDSGTCSFA